MWASRSSSIDALEWAGTILARTLVPSCKFVPSARRVMLPVSSHGTAWRVRKKTENDRIDPWEGSIGD